MCTCLLYELFAWYCFRGFFSHHVDVMYFLQNNIYLETEQLSQVLTYLPWICGQSHQSCREEHIHMQQQLMQTVSLWFKAALQLGCSWVWIKGENEEAVEPGKKLNPLHIIIMPYIFSLNINIFLREKVPVGSHQLSAEDKRAPSRSRLTMILPSAIWLSVRLCRKTYAERGHCFFSQITVDSR